MDRKNFIRKALITGSVGAVFPTILAREVSLGKTDQKQSIVQEGYNHIPNKEIRTMKTVLHKANTRGQANHGWLKAKYSFSFGNYFDPTRIKFGALRVLNDDIISPGKGFGSHPHDNMEIITIPLEGALAHKDSMGNSGIISPGEVQVMSAGTGIQHSEFNKNKDADLKLLQIWVFPNQQQVTPRYEQLNISKIPTTNGFKQILSPNPSDAGVWIHQNAWFHIGELNASITYNYPLKDPSNGVYAFLIEGETEIENQILNPRDGMGIWDSSEIEIKSHAQSKILLMEVPMQINN
jgi:hypothetical protein